MEGSGDAAAVAFQVGPSAAVHRIQDHPHSASAAGAVAMQCAAPPLFMRPPARQSSGGLQVQHPMPAHLHSSAADQASHLHQGPGTAGSGGGGGNSVMTRHGSLLLLNMPRQASGAAHLLGPTMAAFTPSPNNSPVRQQQQQQHTEAGGHGSSSVPRSALHRASRPAPPLHHQQSSPFQQAAAQEAAPSAKTTSAFSGYARPGSVGGAAAPAGPLEYDPPLDAATAVAPVGQAAVPNGPGTHRLARVSSLQGRPGAPGGGAAAPAGGALAQSGAGPSLLPSGLVDDLLVAVAQQALGPSGAPSIISLPSGIAPPAPPGTHPSLQPSLTSGFLPPLGGAAHGGSDGGAAAGAGGHPPQLTISPLDLPPGVPGRSSAGGGPVTSQAGGVLAGHNHGDHPSAAGGWPPSASQPPTSAPGAPMPGTGTAAAAALAAASDLGLHYSGSDLLRGPSALTGAGSSLLQVADLSRAESLALIAAAYESMGDAIDLNTFLLQQHTTHSQPQPGQQQHPSGQPGVSMGMGGPQNQLHPHNHYPQHLQQPHNPYHHHHHPAHHHHHHHHHHQGMPGHPSGLTPGAHPGLMPHHGMGGGMYDPSMGHEGMAQGMGGPGPMDLDPSGARQGGINRRRGPPPRAGRPTKPPPPSRLRTGTGPFGQQPGAEGMHGYGAQPGLPQLGPIVPGTEPPLGLSLAPEPPVPPGLQPGGMTHLPPAPPSGDMSAGKPSPAGAQLSAALHSLAAARQQAISAAQQASKLAFQTPAGDKGGSDASGGRPAGTAQLSALAVALGGMTGNVKPPGPGATSPTPSPGGARMGPVKAAVVPAVPVVSPFASDPSPNGGGEGAAGAPGAVAAVSGVQPARGGGRGVPAVTYASTPHVSLPGAGGAAVAPAAVGIAAPDAKIKQEADAAGLTARVAAAAAAAAGAQQLGGALLRGVIGAAAAAGATPPLAATLANSKAMASLQRKALSQAGRGSTPGGGSDSESGGEDDNGGSDGEDSSGDGRPKKEEDMDVVELWALNVGILNTVGVPIPPHMMSPPLPTPKGAKPPPPPTARDLTAHLPEGERADAMARIRREKNRLAARKCRAKKLESRAELERRMSEVAAGNAQLRARLEALQLMVAREVQTREVLEAFIHTRWGLGANGGALDKPDGPPPMPERLAAVLPPGIATAAQVIAAIEEGTLNVTHLAAQLNALQQQQQQQAWLQPPTKKAPKPPAPPAPGAGPAEARAAAAAVAAPAPPPPQPPPPAPSPQQQQKQQAPAPRPTPPTPAAAPPAPPTGGKGTAGVQLPNSTTSGAAAAAGGSTARPIRPVAVHPRQASLSRDGSLQPGGTGPQERLDSLDNILAAMGFANTPAPAPAPGAAAAAANAAPNGTTQPPQPPPQQQQPAQEAKQPEGGAAAAATQAKAGTQQGTNTPSASGAAMQTASERSGSPTSGGAAGGAPGTKRESQGVADSGESGRTTKKQRTEPQAASDTGPSANGHPSAGARAITRSAARRQQQQP